MLVLLLFCALPPLSDSFFSDSSPVDVFSVTAGELGNDDLSSTSASFTATYSLL